MKSKFLSLLKVDVLGMLGINKLAKGRHGKRKTAVVYGLAALIVVLALIAVGYYMHMFGDIMPTSDKTSLLGIACFSSVVLIVLRVAFMARGRLFGSKDYNMLFSMPVSKRVIISVKTFALYVYSFAFTFLLLVPTFAVLLIFYSFAPSAAFIVRFILSLFIIPLVPVSLSVILGSFIAVLMSKVKRQNIVEIVATVILIAAFLGLIFAFSSGSSAAITGFFDNTFFVKIYLGCFNDTVTFLITAAVSVAVFIVAAVIVNLIFFDINSKLSGVPRKKSKRGLYYVKTSPYAALFKKEFRTLFSTPVYFINALLGIPMIIVMVTVLGVIFHRYGIVSVASPYVTLYAPVAVGFMFNMSPITVSSLSMEGKSFGLLASMPVDFTKLTLVKIAADYALFLPVSLITGVFISLMFSVTFLQALLLTLAVIACVMFGGAAGSYLNLARPNFYWNNPQEAVKQSLPVFLGVVICFVTTAISFVICYFLSAVSVEFALTVFTLFYFALAFAALYLVLARCETLIKKSI